MKKLSVIAMLLVIASLILAACAPVAETPAASGAEEPAAPAAPAAGEKVQIRWFVGLGTGTDPNQLPGQEKLVEEFNASQDKIELVLEIVPFDAAKDTLPKSHPATAPTSSAPLAGVALPPSTASGWT